MEMIVTNLTGKRDITDHDKQTNRKEAERLLPKVFTSNGDVEFREYTHGLGVWATALRQGAGQWISQAEQIRGLFDEKEFLETIMDSDANDFSRQLYQTLSITTGGAAKAIIMTTRAGEGFRAYNELVKHFDPRTNANKVVAMMNFQSPGKRAKDELQFKEYMREWEQEVTKFELKYGEVEDITKVVALMSMMPVNMMEATRAANRDFEKFIDLRKYVVEYMTNQPMKIETTTPKPGQIATVTHDGHTDCEQWCNWSSSGLNEQILYFGKGSYGKSTYGGGGGKDKGKGKGKSFNSNHYGTWNNYGQQGKDGGKGKNRILYQDSALKGKGGGKGGKDGKNKGDGRCWRCGGVGHLARDCATPSGKGGINLIDEGYEDYAKDAERSDDDHKSTNDDIGGGMWTVATMEDMEAWIDTIAGHESELKSMEIKVKGKKIELKNKYEVLGEGSDDEDMTCDNVDQGELHSIMETKGDFARIEATVDTGAADHAFPTCMFPDVPVLRNEASKKGKCFFDASGNPIPNQGEKVVQFYTPKGLPQKIKYQVTPVVKPLISAGKLEDAGCKIVIDGKDKYIVNPGSNEKIKMYKKNGTYKIDLWIKKSEVGEVFNRRGK